MNLFTIGIYPFNISSLHVFVNPWTAYEICKKVHFYDHWIFLLLCWIYYQRSSSVSLITSANMPNLSKFGHNLTAGWHSLLTKLPYFPWYGSPHLGFQNSHSRSIWSRNDSKVLEISPANDYTYIFKFVEIMNILSSHMLFCKICL